MPKYFAELEYGILLLFNTTSIYFISEVNLNCFSFVELDAPLFSPFVDLICCLLKFYNRFFGVSMAVSSAKVGIFTFYV